MFTDARPVDMGVLIQVVRQDPGGKPAWPGSAPIRYVGEPIPRGGIVDPGLRRFIGPSKRPKLWYVSEQQLPLLLHEDQPDKILCYGAMGAGKSVLLAMWLYLRAIELCERGLCIWRRRAIGATAPARDRLKPIIKHLGEVGRPGWGVHKKADNDIILACGVDIELRATKEQSGALGNPLQGQDWSAAASDEMQDQIHAAGHILMRGRAAPEGRYKQFCTATAKDSLSWREYRDSLSPDHWGIRRLEGHSNPFVPPSIWEAAKDNLSEREYRMRVLAQDVGPERQMFTAWDRYANIQPVPEVGAGDITRHVLQATGGQQLLIGYDPGTFRNCSVFLRALRLHDSLEPHWFVVGEFATEQTTTEEHAQAMAEYLLRGHGLRPQQCLVRRDPWTEVDARGDRSIEAQLRAAGYLCKSARYVSTQAGQSVSKHVPLHASVEMVNRLSCSASGRRRLFIAEDSGGVAAPELHRALQLSEWDVFGRKENVRKDDKRKDPSDWTSSLRYALWPYERSRPGERKRSWG